MKRAFDIIGSAVLIILLSPLLLATAVAVAVTMGRPVLFRQQRTGLGGKIFTLYKFRTMTNARDESGNLLPDERRLTRLGKFLRATSIDELPELFNVLRGDMSLVGPRPLLPEYLPRYNAFQARRHEVKPGITGWAQIHGRNLLSWEKKFEYDVWYVDHRSFWLDIWILLLTVAKVIKREGISEKGMATASPFLGSDSSDREVAQQEEL
ncbi:MAG: sugar transferase [Armatimonadota bacterium]|nr:sugar transferase [Armatimonadota bacterium]